MKKLVLIDGNALLYRAFHAYPPFTSPKGELVGAVFGFSTLLLSVLDRLSPTHVIVAWDLKGPTFRKQGFENYKANRKPMDESLVIQISRTKEVVDAFNIPQFGIDGYEADDIIGTLSKKAAEDLDVQVIIVTGDRDALQLVEGKKIVVYLPIQNKYSQSVVFDEEKVKEMYGMDPLQIIDLKGLMGDASDNIPGVKGVGKVTATKLIQEFKTIEEIYKNIESKSIADRTRMLLKADEQMGRKSRELAEIDRNVPVDMDWEKSLLVDYDKEKVRKLFEELNFKSLANRLPENNFEKEVEDVFI